MFYHFVLYYYLSPFLMQLLTDNYFLNFTLLFVSHLSHHYSGGLEDWGLGALPKENVFKGS